MAEDDASGNDHGTGLPPFDPASKGPDFQKKSRGEFPLMPFTIRIDMESMKHSIVKAFTGYEAELQEYADKAINHAIENFDFGALIRNETHRKLEEQIKMAVGHALSEVFYSPSFREALEGSFDTLLLDSMKKRVLARKKFKKAAKEIPTKDGKPLDREPDRPIRVTDEHGRE